MGLQKKSKRRLLIVMGLIVGIIVSGWYFGLADDLSPERIRALVHDAGLWGVLLFFGIFICGHLLHLPGLIFITGGAVAFGSFWGGILSLIAATLAICINFVLIRRIGGQPLQEIENPHLRRLMKGVDRRPLLTVIIFRLVGFTAAWISVVFALSNVRFRDHLVGSIIGMAPPVLGAAWLADMALAYLSK
jgi:uncharacterized membrane protein YdjX (TVP38/TMEM64 family)